MGGIECRRAVMLMKFQQKCKTMIKKKKAIFFLLLNSEIETNKNKNKTKNYKKINKQKST
jgi:hypothetical protein